MSNFPENYEGLELLLCPFLENYYVHFLKIHPPPPPQDMCDIWCALYTNYLKILEANLWPLQVRVQDLAPCVIGAHPTAASHCLPLLISLLFMLLLSFIYLAIVYVSL